MRPKKEIVVLQHGWVAVGSFSGPDAEGQCTLNKARIIRRWGTTQGLGQLAASGPTANTILDPAGTLRFGLSSVVCRFEVEGDW